MEAWVAYLMSSCIGVGLVVAFVFDGWSGIVGFVRDLVRNIL